MDNYDVTVDAVATKNADYNVAVLKPEYVLKVNNIHDNNAPAKAIPTKSNPNPENLPAIRKTKKSRVKSFFLYFFFFIFIFLVAAIIGYKTVFYLFTI